MMNKRLKGTGDLKEIEDMSAIQFLQSLFVVDEHLALKTHIVRPKDLSALNVLGFYTRKSGDYGKCGHMVGKWIQVYLEYMVSFNREGRKEGIRGISSLFDKETIRMTLGERLTSNLS